MKKSIKNLLAVGIIATSAPLFAENFGANDYEDEGMLLFKVRGAYINTSAEIKADSTQGGSKPGDLVALGYSIDAATTYFFSDNFATELSLGWGVLKTKNTALQKATSAYGDGSYTVTKRNNIQIIPAAATLQYHIAPYGGIRPYVGAGYHGSYLYTHSKLIKVKPAHGFVLQAGVDFVAKDDTFVTLDIKKYFLEPKITFKKGLLYSSGGSDFTTKAKMDPLVVAFGLGFKF